MVTEDGTELDAKLIGTDDRTDLALLKVDGNDFNYVTFAKDEPKVGQWVLAVGNPFGLGGTVTAGILSAEGRDIGSGPYDNFLQIDAPVNRGNSGGPTFNVQGEVVGVNTAIFSPSGGNVGIAFAIPAADGGGDRQRSPGARRGHPRLARRSDPAGDGGHRQEPWHRRDAGRDRRRRDRPRARPRAPGSRPATSSSR